MKHSLHKDKIWKIFLQNQPCHFVVVGKDCLDNKQPLCEESSMLIGQALVYRGDTLHWIHPEMLSHGFEMSSCYYSGKKNNK